MSKKQKTLRDIKMFSLSQSKQNKVWKMLDDWYNNTEIWDLLELSGLINTPLNKLK